MDRETVVNRAARRLGLPLRGSYGIAHVRIAVVVIFLVTIFATAWWSLHSQTLADRLSRSEQFTAVGQTLVSGVDASLSNGDLSSLRRLVVQAVQGGQLVQCRVVLSDGRVIADGDLSRITLTELPDQWQGQPAGEDLTRYENGMIMRSVWLEVPSMGYVSVEMAAMADSGRSVWSMQAGLGLISTLAMLALVMLARLVKTSSQGINAIRMSLMDFQSGHESSSALEINPDWGPEAQAWNQLLAQTDQLRLQVTREKTIEALQDRRESSGDLNAACDALSQGLILIGRDMKVSYANGAAAVLLQIGRDELMSSDITDKLPDPQLVDAVQAATSMESHRRTIIEVNKDSEDNSGVLRFIVRPVRRDDHGVGMIIIEDITQQRLAEESRNAFVVQATHELRTPLTNIRLYAEMAIDDGDDDPAVRANCLNVINQETHRLDSMVGDILSLSEIEAGTLSIKRDDVRLEDLFNGIQNDYTLQAKEKKIDFSFVLPPNLPVIQGDRGKIALGMHNLIGNALKYTPAEGRVSVNVTIEESVLAMEVSDSGIGIAEEDCKRIFEKFYRAKDRRVAEATGSGLGLAIAREVIRLHGGDITVESVHDKGSTFTLTLPV